MTEKRTRAAGASIGAERYPLSLRLGEFGWRSLEDVAARHRIPIEGLIADACGYFAVEIADGRIATRLPRFRSPEGEGTPRELELELPARTWQALEGEAERQDTDLTRIVEHASLLYIADLDSGRAIRRFFDGESD